MLVHPQTVTLQLTYVSTSGQLLGTDSRRVPWGSAVTGSNAAGYLTSGLTTYTITGIRDKDGTAQSAILLDEHAFYNQAGDYPVTIVLQPPHSDNNNSGGNENPTPPSSGPSSTSTKPRSSSSSSSSSTSAPSKSDSMPDTSGSSASNGTSMVSQSSAETPPPAAYGAGSSTGSQSGSNSSSGEAGTLSAALAVVLSNIMAPLATAGGAAATGSLAFLLLLFLLLFLPSSIKITFRTSQNGKEKRYTKRKFFWKNSDGKNLLLDISDKRVLEHFDHCSVDIRFGWAYRKKVADSHLQIAYYDKTAVLEITGALTAAQNYTVSLDATEFAQDQL